MAALNAVIDLELVRSRLETELGSAARRVELLADAAAVMEARVLVEPAVYVVPGIERAEDLSGNMLAQRVRVSFGLLQVVRHAGDVQGAAALGGGRLRTLRQACLGAMQGWVMDAATGEPVSHQDGRVVKIAPGGVLIWLDAFAVTMYRGV